MENMVERLIAMGGKEWKGGANHRIYLNSKMIGLEVSVYGRRSSKGSNCKSSWLNNEEISNNKAFNMLCSIEKAYYDVVKSEFVGLPSGIEI